MDRGHCFDRFLEKASGEIKEQIRELGNGTHNDVEIAAKEWEQGVDSFYPKESDVVALPNGTWLLKVSFILSKPFTSKAEGEIHHQRYDKKLEKWLEVHNPIARDPLMGLPFVKPTIWKGHLRFAARLHFDSGKARLFGSSNSEENARRGRLHFFPTFFTGPVKREVVTPLNRHSRTPTRGRGPISIEVMPAGDQGIFWLLYTPYPKGMEWTPRQIAEDLEAVGKAVTAMFSNISASIFYT
jgi:CRISPR-associated protein Cmr2